MTDTDRPVLYHGTSERRAQQIEASGALRCAPYGDQHVSLTDAIEVAKYFASLACTCDAEDFSFGGRMAIFRMDKGRLAEAGMHLLPFQSVNGDAWERETACMSDIPFNLIEGVEYFDLSEFMDTVGA